MNGSTRRAGTFGSTASVLSAAMLVFLVMTASPAAADQDGPASFEASFWYVIDHVTDVAPDARVTLVAVLPRDREHQDIKIGNIHPVPEEVLTDPDHGNRIVVWRVNPEPGAEQIFFRVDFSGTASAWRVDVDPDLIEAPSRGTRVYRTYTASERWLETGGDVARTAADIVGGERNPYLQARRIFEWMIENLEFLPGGGHDLGAAATLRAGRGDCGQYSRLFVAMCRSLGIPSRTVMNIWMDGERHCFAEIHLEPYGWIPVDVTAAQALEPDHSLFDEEDRRVFRLVRGIPDDDPGYFFGGLYRNHVAVTVGNNIAPPAPEGRTPVVYTILEPGGLHAEPESIDIQGLNDDVIHGGFYVFDRRLSPEEAHQMAHQEFAEEFLGMGLYDAVESGCLMAQRDHTDGVRTWINMGRVHMHKGDYSRAEACFLRAINEASVTRHDKAESMVWAHNYLGNCYDMMERRELALAEYRRVIDLGIDVRGAVDYARRHMSAPFKP